MCRCGPDALLGPGTHPGGTPLQATLASGWDVISPEEGYLTEELQERLQSCSAAAAPPGASKPACGQHVQLRRGELLHDVDKTVRHFYFLIEVWSSSAPPCSSRSLLGMLCLNVHGREQALAGARASSVIRVTRLEMFLIWAEPCCSHDDSMLSTSVAAVFGAVRFFCLAPHGQRALHRRKGILALFCAGQHACGAARQGQEEGDCPAGPGQHAGRGRLPVQHPQSRVHASGHLVQASCTWRP